MEQKIMKRTAAALFAALSVFILAGELSAQRRTKVRPPKPAPLTAAAIAQSGNFAGTLYTNKSLGFKITVPDGWKILDDSANRATLAAGGDIIKDNKSRTYKTEVDRSLSNAMLLFQAMPLDPTNTQATGVFACGVETATIGHTLASYMEMNKKIMLSSVPGSKLIRNTYSMTAGGAVFQAVDIERATLSGAFKQTMMVTNRKGAMFFFVLTYPDDDGRKMLEEALATLTFSK